jgi:phosphoribosylcarboxyaminoimidazole (NCAIR) mutase
VISFQVISWFQSLPFKFNLHRYIVAGLVDAPVIAVPTSIGYGAALGGLSPLLATLNSCAVGVTVVNIDNGFGAAMAAIKMLRVAERVAARKIANDAGRSY